MRLRVRRSIACLGAIACALLAVAAAVLAQDVTTPPRLDWLRGEEHEYVVSFRFVIGSVPEGRPAPALEELLLPVDRPVPTYPREVFLDDEALATAENRSGKLTMRVSPVYTVVCGLERGRLEVGAAQRRWLYEAWVEPREDGKVRLHEWLDLRRLISGNVGRPEELAYSDLALGETCLLTAGTPAPPGAAWMAIYHLVDNVYP